MEGRIITAGLELGQAIAMARGAAVGACLGISMNTASDSHVPWAMIAAMSTPSAVQYLSPVYVGAPYTSTACNADRWMEVRVPADRGAPDLIRNAGASGEAGVCQHAWRHAVTIEIPGRAGTSRATALEGWRVVLDERKVPSARQGRGPRPPICWCGGLPRAHQVGLSHHGVATHEQGRPGRHYITYE